MSPEIQVGGHCCPPEILRLAQHCFWAHKQEGKSVQVITHSYLDRRLGLILLPAIVTKCVTSPILSAPSKHMNAGHHQPASEMPFKWHFAGRTIVAGDWLLTRHVL